MRREERIVVGPERMSKAPRVPSQNVPNPAKWRELSWCGRIPSRSRVLQVAHSARIERALVTSAPDYARLRNTQ